METEAQSIFYWSLSVLCIFRTVVTNLQRLCLQQLGGGGGREGSMQVDEFIAVSSLQTWSPEWAHELTSDGVKMGLTGWSGPQ